MSWLSEEDIAWLQSNVAPHSSTLEKWNHVGAYFRSLNAPESGMLEVAYNAIRPGQKFDVTLLTTDEYAAHGGDITKTVYHGTSLAAASLIINNGHKPSYGAWRGPQCLRIAPPPGIPTVYTTPHWNTALRYRGNSTETSIASGPVGMVVLECFYELDKRIARIKGKNLNDQWLFHPKSLRIHKFHFVCTAAAQDSSILERMELDADVTTTTLTSKKRRNLASLIRRAKNHVSDLKCGVPERIRRLPRLGKIMKKKIYRVRRLRARPRVAQAGSSTDYV